MNSLNTPLCLFLSAMLIVSCVEQSSASDVAAAAPLEVIETSGNVDHVTVYRGQALVTRRVEFGGDAGLKELVITDLPEYALPTSLHAEAPQGVRIRSVRYRERPVRADVRDEVKQLETKIATLRDELAKAESSAVTIASKSAYLDKLEQFAAAGSIKDLSHGVLNADSLKELSAYLFQQRESLAEENLSVTFTRRDLQNEIELLQRELRTLGARSSRTARETVIIVDSQRGGNTHVDLYYLVNRANWTPSYAVRGDVDGSTLNVEYFASIEQTSGEDWGNVNMTLSTATPSLVARAPMLAALSVKLQPAAAAPPGPPGARSELLAMQRGAERDRAQAADQSSRAFSGGGGGSLFGEPVPHGAHDDKLNMIADQIQLLEYTGGGDLEPELTAPTNEGHSVTYSIAGRTSLPSRSGQQMIQIAAAPLAGEFYKVAIPVLTSYVYEEAVVSNRTGYVLLGGPVATYAGGQFVGHSSFDETAIGENMTVGLGINSLLRSERYVLNQDERVQGGNRVVDITFRLSIQNFGEQPTVIRLKDRLPQVRPNEIKLTIIDDGANHEQVRRHTHDQVDGIMIWDVEVPAAATGAEAISVDYTIRLEYDRQMTIAGM